MQAKYKFYGVNLKSFRILIMDLLSLLSRKMSTASVYSENMEVDPIIEDEEDEMTVQVRTKKT